MLLEALGYEVVIEYHPKRALERVNKEMPDVFLLDIGLPEIDGNELAQRLRAHSNFGKATLVALTGYGQESDRIHTQASGFDHHLVKPVDTQKLANILAKINGA